MLTNVKFRISLYTQKARKDGKYPIVILVSWREHGKDYVRRKYTGVGCYKDQFDHEKERIKSEVWAASRWNTEIDIAIRKANNVYRDYFYNYPWDYRKWSELYDAKYEKETFDTYTLKLIERQKLLTKAGNARFYRDSLRALQKFMRKETIHFEEITKRLLRGLEEDYLIRGFKGERTMRGLRAIYSKAVEDEVVDLKYMPFKTPYSPVGYKFSHLAKIKRPTKLMKRLSKSQVRQLFEYVPENQGEERAMDLWKFSYYTMGVNLKDIMLMKYVDIQDGLWYYNRAKTNISSMGKPLLPECIEIIDKYFDPENKYVFHFLLGGYDETDEMTNDRKRDVLSNLNRRYKKISKKLEFDGHISFYTARYTSATISANSGADLRAVQLNLTHASIRTTEIYTQFRDEEALRKSLEVLRVEPLSKQRI